MHSESVTIGGQAHTQNQENPALLLIGLVELTVWGNTSPFDAKQSVRLPFWAV
jgi:hypothetical protein